MWIVFAFLFIVFPFSAFAECVSVDKVTKCARLPEEIYMTIMTQDIADTNYDDDSWAGSFNGHIVHGTAYEVGSGMQRSTRCVIDGPFYAMAECAFSPVYNTENINANCSSPWEHCDISVTYSNGISAIDGDECPVGSYTVPYDLSCGKGFVDVANVPHCTDDMSGDFCLLSKSCESGYFLDDENVCQICPVNYWCSGDGEPQSCFGFSNVTGAADWYDCDVQGIPPGKELYYDGDKFWEYSDCSAGYYCPGSDKFYSVGSSWDETFGRIACPSGVGPSGAVSVDQCCPEGFDVQDNQCVMPESCESGYFLDEDTGLCVRCPVGYYCDGVGAPMACPKMPEMPDDKWWGYVGLGYLLDFTGTISDCGGYYIYGDLPSYQRMLEMFLSGDGALYETDFLMSPLLGIFMAFGVGGYAVYENPKYSAASPINSAGAGTVMLQYDETTENYMIAVMATGCRAGYWAEYGISNGSDNVFFVETSQQISDYLCKPVGVGYWGAGTVYDMGEPVGGAERNACPVGMITDGYGVGADSADDCRLMCADGYTEMNGKCVQMCKGGISHLKTGSGLSYSLWAEKYTSPSLCVRHNDTVCYGNLEQGQATGAININYNGTIYHMAN